MDEERSVSIPFNRENQEATKDKQILYKTQYEKHLLQNED